MLSDLVDIGPIRHEYCFIQNAPDMLQKQDSIPLTKIPQN